MTKDEGRKTDHGIRNTVVAPRSTLHAPRHATPTTRAAQAVARRAGVRRWASGRCSR